MVWNAGQSTTPSPHALNDLVQQVADADGRAFARLYQALAPAVARDLRPAMPDPADAAAVIAATFVEVWWLARFHAAAGTDVPAWVMAVARRRAWDRIGAAPGTDTGDHSPAVARPPVISGQAVQDEHHTLVLAGLLNHPPAADRGRDVR